MGRWIGTQGQVTSAKKTRKHAPLWRHPQKIQNEKFFFHGLICSCLIWESVNCRVLSASTNKSLVTSVESRRLHTDCRKSWGGPYLVDQSPEAHSLCCGARRQCQPLSSHFNKNKYEYYEQSREAGLLCSFSSAKPQVEPALQVQSLITAKLFR